MLLASLLVGSVATAIDCRAETGNERQYAVSLQQTHIGDLEVDTMLLDSYGPPPKNVRQFYSSAQEALTAEKGRDFSHDAVLGAERRNTSLCSAGPCWVTWERIAWLCRQRRIRS